MAEEIAGSIVINTELSTTQFNKDVSGIQRAITSLNNKITGLGPTFQKAMQGNSSAIQTFNGKASILNKTIASIEGQMRELANAKLPTEDYAFAAEQLRKVEQELERLYKREDQLSSRGVSEQSTAWQNLQSDIEYAKERIQQYKLEMEGMRNSGDAFTSGIDTEAFAQLEEALRGAKEELAYMESSVPRATSALSRIGEVGTKAFGGLKKFISSAFNGLKNIGKHTKTAEGQIARLTRRLTGLFGQIGTRIKRALVSGIYNGLKQGINNIAQYSSSVNAALSSMKSALTQLKNSFGAAFAPIITAAVPHLVTLINYVSKAVEWVGKLIAALTGKKTYTRATAAQESYAESLNNTASSAKEARRQLAGFDELNILSANSSGSGSGGSSGGISPSDMFEEAELDSGTINFAERIKTAIQADDWEGVGSILAECVNGVIDKVNNFLDQDKFEKVGEAVGKGISGAVSTFKWDSAGEMLGKAVSSLVSFLYGVVKNTKFTEIGKGIGEAIRTAINNIEWEKIGGLTAATFNGLIDILKGLITSDALKDFAKGLGKAAATAINNIDWKNIGETFNDFLQGILDAILAALDGMTAQDWEALGTGIGEAIAAIDWQKALEKTGEIIWKIFLGILNAVKGLFVGLSLTEEELAIRKDVQKIKQDIDGLVNGTNQKLDEIDTNKLSALKLVDELEYLQKHGGTIDELRGKISDILDIYPELIEYVNAEGTGFINGNEAIKNQIELLDRKYKMQALEDSLTEAYKQQVEAQKAYDEAMENLPTVSQFLDANSAFLMGGSFTLGGSIDHLKLGVEALANLETFEQAKKNLDDAGKNVEYFKNQLVEASEAATSVGDSTTKATTETETAGNRMKTTVAPLIEDGITRPMHEAQSGVESSSTKIGNSFGGISTAANNKLAGVETNVKSRLDKAMKAGETSTNTGVKTIGDSYETLATKFSKPVGTLKISKDSKFDAIKTDYNSIKSATVTKTTKGATDKTFTTTKNDYNAIKSNTVTKTAGGSVTQAFQTLKSTYNGIVSNTVTKTASGAINAAFNTTKNSFNSVVSNTATKTIAGYRSSSFDNVKSAYDGIKDKTATVTIKASTSGSNSRQQNYILGLATGGIITAAGAVRSFANGGKVMNSGRSNWWNGIQKYASGTARAHGTMFIAGEAGPEVVGHVNGRTEILNKSQIAQAIYSAMVAAGQMLVHSIAGIFSRPIDISLSGDLSTLSGINNVKYRTPYSAGALLPYDVQGKAGGADIVGAIEGTGDELMETIVNALSAQTASILAAIDRIRTRQGTSGSVNASDIIAEINRQTRVYNQSPLLN